VDPHAKGGGSQSTAARSRIDVRRYRGVRPDELRAASAKRGIGVEKKAKKEKKDFNLKSVYNRLGNGQPSFTAMATQHVRSRH
jgi:hypothetical protein